MAHSPISHFLTVFCSFWSQNQSRSSGHRSHLGLHYSNLRSRIFSQVYSVLFDGKGLWLHHSRIWRRWSAHVLQGVGSVDTSTRFALITHISLVELIVLNVGYQAKILNERIFSMFVLHAIVLTFITTPLTLFIYPPRVRGRDGTSLEKALTPGTGATTSSEELTRTKFAVILDGMEQLPSAMTLIQLLRSPSTGTRSPVTEKSSIEKGSIQSEVPVVPYLPEQTTISIDALRLVELTERTSAVLRSQAADTLVHNDPVLSVFRTFGRLNHFSMSGALSVISHDEFSTHVADHVRENGSQMTVIPWPVTSSATGASSNSHTTSYNPFDSLFPKIHEIDETAALLRSQFVRKVFANCSSDVALFIDRGFSTDSSASIYPHIFLPFFGGPDDRLALSFVVQLCMHEGISATVIRLQRVESDGRSVHTVGEKSAFHYGDVSLRPCDLLRIPDVVPDCRIPQYSVLPA